MRVQEKKWIRVRIYVVAVFFIIGLGTILFRAFQLQVLERDRLDSIARSGYKAVVKLPPKRGTVYDREGRELAVSIEVGSIYANPRLVQDKNHTAGQLALCLDASQKHIRSLLDKDRSFVWIERKVSPEKARQVRDLGLKGVGLTTETRRFYPGKDIAGHLLGLVGSDNQGLEGLEKRYDKVLKGPQQTLIQMQDALGRPFYINRPAGSSAEMHNLILTIDRDIQYKAQQALEAAVKKSKGKSGQCLIMDPETGEILAMAVAPPFNPNIFGEYGPNQWRNRTITDVYEPGSTMKAFLLAAALEHHVVAPHTQFYCEDGEYVVAGHTIHDTKEYGSLSVSDIVVLSSNIGAVKIGKELGYGRFSEYLQKFGFGSETGIDLIGERKGFVRPPENAREIDQATIFFGQGMTCTSMQLIAAMAAIANGGRLMRPYVVKAVTDQSGRIIRQVHPRLVRRVLSRETAKKVTEIMEGVVSERGTAPAAAIKGYRVAGKTGTSQKVDQKTRSYSYRDYIAIFVGFVPVESPRLAILVMVNEPKGVVYGGLVAGPVFREVGTWALHNMRIHPELRLAALREELRMEHRVPRALKDEVPRVLENPGLLPDFRGKTMREVLKRGSELGLQVIIEGTGLAVTQSPEPGAFLGEVSSVRISFRPPA